MYEEEKKRLRAEIRIRRADLSAERMDSASRRIQELVLGSAWYREAASVFTYVSMPGEPATDRILRQALADGKRVYVPRCRGGEMLAVRIDDPGALRPGMMGIPEPQECRETLSAEKLDLILVPCVSASPDGRRLGHGGGYYDRFLHSGAERAVCLCFADLICQEIPVTALDVRIPRVVTEHSEKPD